MCLFENSLSKAVVLYLKGTFPNRNSAALARRFGAKRAEQLEAEIKDILNIASAIVPVNGDLAKHSRKMQEFMKATYPKLSRRAVRAVAWYCTYIWK